MNNALLALTKSQIDTVCQIALMIPVADAEAVLNEMGRMDALMPIVDPTGYRKIMRNVPGHEDEVRAFLTFRRELERIAPKEPVQEAT